MNSESNNGSALQDDKFSVVFGSKRKDASFAREMRNPGAPQGSQFTAVRDMSMSVGANRNMNTYIEALKKYRGN